MPLEIFNFFRKKILKNTINQGDKGNDEKKKMKTKKKKGENKKPKKIVHLSLFIMEILSAIDIF